MKPKLTPLYVDLDDTLIKCDTLIEQVLCLIKDNPFKIFSCFFWLLKGKVFLKKKVYSEVSFSTEELPLREKVVQLIKEEKEKGREVFLLSAAHDNIVRSFFYSLGLFDNYWGTKEVNCKGVNKLKVIDENGHLDDFIYAGDSQSDMAIWKESKKAIVINPNNSLKKKVEELKKPVEYIYDDLRRFKSIVKCIRPHQWVKNSLLFLPFFLSHKGIDLLSIKDLALGAIGFSLLASSVYIYNDLSDLSADRKHPKKRHRPLASGDLPVTWAIALAFSFLTISFSLASSINYEFFFICMTYLICNIFYTSYLKKIIVLDVIILASFYSLRLLAGGAVSQTQLSFWLLCFSTFFFLGLALVKRYVDLRNKFDGVSSGRGYERGDMDIVGTSGVTTSLLSVLVLAQYMTTSAVDKFYPNKSILWLLIPIFTYWNLRIWLLAQRNKVDSDPVAFAIKDFASWIVGGIVVLVLYLASLNEIF